MFGFIEYKFLSDFFFNDVNYESLESSNQYERAACLAVLTDNYEQALETLDNAHNSGKNKTFFINNQNLLPTFIFWCDLIMCTLILFKFF